MFNKLILLFIVFFTPIFSENFVLFTEPKTGTHLLIPILTSLTRKQVYWAKDDQENTPFISENNELDLENSEFFFFSTERLPWTKSILDRIWDINERQGSYLHLHAPYSTRMEKYLFEKQCITFFIKRDPRDQIVSLLNHYKHIHLNDLSLKDIASDEEKLLFMIKKDLRKSTLLYRGWLTSSICCVLDFGKLMGAHGGAASDIDALNEMKKIAAALKLHISTPTLEKIYKSHFGRGWNFFEGKVGSWKRYFNEEHKIAVKEEIGDLLIELGYEKDNDW